MNASLTVDTEPKKNCDKGSLLCPQEGTSLPDPAPTVGYPGGPPALRHETVLEHDVGRANNSAVRHLNRTPNQRNTSSLRHHHDAVQYHTVTLAPRHATSPNYANTLQDFTFAVLDMRYLTLPYSTSLHLSLAVSLPNSTPPHFALA